MAGKGQMPAFGQSLTLPKMQALSGYVRRLGAERIRGPRVTIGERRCARRSVCGFRRSGTAFAQSKRRRHHKRSKPASGKTCRDPAAEGRAHLKKANALAGEDDCAAAIEEYTLGLRHAGRSGGAVQSRRVLPPHGRQRQRGRRLPRRFSRRCRHAPNRADIEAKIAALSAGRRRRREPRPNRRRSRRRTPPAAAAGAAAAPPPAAGARAEPGKPAPAVAIERGRRGGEAPRVDRSSSRFWLWTALAVAGRGRRPAATVFFFGRVMRRRPTTTFGNYRLLMRAGARAPRSVTAPPSWSGLPRAGGAGMQPGGFVLAGRGGGRSDARSRHSCQVTVSAGMQAKQFSVPREPASRDFAADELQLSSWIAI